jgi:hypothetical protein
MVSIGRRDPPTDFALEELSICSAETRSNDGRASPRRQRPPRGQMRFTHPLESLSCVRRYARLRPENRRPRVQDFPGNPLRPSLRTLRAVERAVRQFTVVRYVVRHGADAAFSAIFFKRSRGMRVNGAAHASVCRAVRSSACYFRSSGPMSRRSRRVGHSRRSRKSPTPAPPVARSSLMRLSHRPGQAAPSGRGILNQSSVSAMSVA